MATEPIGLYERLEQRYASGDIPWDNPQPPPEVLELIPTLAPGRALDLGCGYGRSSIYMAGQGWNVDAIDFIPMAIAEAAERSRKAGVSVRFHIGSVIDLDFLAGPYDLALDVGCSHNLKAGQLKTYRDQLWRLLRLGGHYLLFARIRDPSGVEDDVSPSGLEERMLLNLYDEGFELLRNDHGVTEVTGQSPWNSAWFLFRRL
jgi:SAM-dependent methyltransferase